MPSPVIPELSATVQPVTVSAPVTDAGPAVRDRQAGDRGRQPLPTENTTTAWLPLIVTRLAPGPWITSGPVGWLSSSVLVRVIVWREEE